MPLSVKTLLDRLLFAEALVIGRSSTEAKTILDPSTASLVYSLPLSISVYQEQFTSSRSQPQTVRFPLSSVLCKPDEALKTNVWFPEEYLTFSIDIRWLRPNGSVPFGLERIFAVAN